MVLILNQAPSGCVFEFHFSLVSLPPGLLWPAKSSCLFPSYRKPHRDLSPLTHKILSQLIHAQKVLQWRYHQNNMPQKSKTDITQKYAVICGNFLTFDPILSSIFNRDYMRCNIFLSADPRECLCQVLKCENGKQANNAKQSLHTLK